MNYLKLPAGLLEAVSAPGGGKIALIVGAGCSVEEPTCVPVSSTCSKEVHRRLVDDAVLTGDECADPGDLSAVADAVFAKTNSQRDVVVRLSQQYDFKTASPNEGYHIAAAMLCEGVLSSLVTLNFDLAMTTALSDLGVGHIVGVIDGPDDLPGQKNINIYYLHRNANSLDPEKWILRTDALKQEWKDHWERIIATKVLIAPVVVFVGLGTPVAVLVESTKLVLKVLPQATKFFQVDVGEMAGTAFFQALELDPKHYIKSGWVQFMEDLSERLLKEQLEKLDRSIEAKIKEDNLQKENIAPLLRGLQSIGIVKGGKIRANWLLHDKIYYPFESNALGLVASILLALGMIARISGAEVAITEDGLVEFFRDDRAVAVYILASGSGHLGRVAIEARVRRRLKQYRGRRIPVNGALVSSTADSWKTRPTSPDDLVQGYLEEGDIVTGSMAFAWFHIGEVRENEEIVHVVVP